MALQEVRWRHGLDLPGSGQKEVGLAIVNEVMNLRVPQNAWNFLTS